MSWLKKGFDAVTEEQTRREEAYGVPEVWIKKGEFRDLLFVDGEPSCVNRHTVWINGDAVTFTCLQDTGSPDVPCCEILGTKKNRNYTGNYTVIDVTAGKDKQGNENKPAIKLYSAKYRSIQLLKTKQADYGTLVGKVFRVRRTDDKSVTTGDDFGYQGDKDLSKYFSVATYKGKLYSELVAKETEKMAKVFSLDAGEKTNKIVPLDYFKVLHPKKPSEIRNILRGYKPTDKDEGTSTQTQTDDVPF